MSGVDGLECPRCLGAGRLAPTGEGLFEYLAKISARIAGLRSAEERASALLARYLSENIANDHRIAGCEIEIASIRASMEHHIGAAHNLRHGGAATCLQCRGDGELFVAESFAPQTSEEFVATLTQSLGYADAQDDHAQAVGW